jgi:hypothetical protein
MVTDLISQPQSATLTASKLPSLLRALADPEGKGELSSERAATIQQIETNLARHREAGRPRRTDATAAGTLSISASRSADQLSAPEPTPGFEPGTPSSRER